VERFFHLNNQDIRIRVNPTESLSEEGIAEITKRTESVSASFIKELMRRIVQFHIEADGTGMITHTDIDNALDEMLFKGGTLNLKLLGAKAE